MGQPDGFVKKSYCKNKKTLHLNRQRFYFLLRAWDDVRQAIIEEEEQNKISTPTLA